MDPKTHHEQILTSELRKHGPQPSSVAISFDGQFAIYNVADRYILRKLSKTARTFVREGGDIATVAQSLFES